MISFIVSAYDRPDHLRCCLASLDLQGDHEIIVCDNGGTLYNQAITNHAGVIYLNTSKLVPQTCYHGLEAQPDGNWLCFPSDDSYYVPNFARIMLHTAEANNWEFVYSDVLYDPRLAHATRGLHDTYSVMDTQPHCGSFDKTCFIVTRRAFEQVGGWPRHEADWRDGALAEALVNAGIRHGKAPGILLVHN